ncbi:hypothetical protein QP794_22440 [Paenibacillus sp. UMB7766-LJ446]|uniref:hypothetical protein n=1 Tax=Paenibacillus sp. UMB7766-LJ446 TaxID=3046313 RepID=UPI002550A0DA|nr:hypothetical protein [Paenibacillus sp. UMB7766-LJ446]MDK8192849.1 hypothetical protein [Paenibacillus sp. UMB7766-LJ446]
MLILAVVVAVITGMISLIHISIWIKGFRGRHEVVGQYFRVSVFPIPAVHFSEE